MAESRASWTVNSAFQLTLFQFELENDELHFFSFLLLMQPGLGFVCVKSS